MKKLLAFMLVVLLLTGCQKAPASSEPEEPVSQPEETIQTVPEEPVEEPSVVEIPVEIIPSHTEEDIDFSVEQREGQVEDSVGYILDCPVFSGFDAAETVNQFYVDLADYLEGYIKETVYTETMKRFTVTDVYGRCQSVSAQDGELTVEYTLSIVFHDTDEEIVKSRTDYFNMSTGEVRSDEN